MQFDQYDLTVYTFCLSAVLSGDYSGLTDYSGDPDDDKYADDVTAWCQEKADGQTWHLTTPDDLDESAYFGFEDFRKLRGTVIELTLYVAR